MDFAIKIDAASVELLGVPYLTLGATFLEVRLNQGSAIGWPTWTCGTTCAGFPINAANCGWGNTQMTWLSARPLACSNCARIFTSL